MSESTFLVGALRVWQECWGCSRVGGIGDRDVAG